MTDVSRATIENCLYNWLGYGNPNGKFWFVGIEESLNLRKCTNVDTVRDYFQIRSEFDLAMDLEETHHELLGRPLSTFNRDTAWHKSARFLLAWEGHDPDLNQIGRYVDGPQAKLGRDGSHNFALETFPLIKASSSSVGRYGDIWDSVDEYHEEVLPGRMDLMVNTLETNPNVEWIYVYGLSQSNPSGEKLLERFPSSFVGEWKSGTPARNPRVYELEITDDRIVRLIHGPFPKQGMSNKATKTLAQDLQAQFD
jgi:hypothetical protein